MRIDGFSSQSYPLKRKPRKANVTVDESVEDSPDFIEVQSEASSPQGAANARTSGLPARQQDMVFPRSMSKSVATALASYLTTAGFVEWDMEVLGLDIHI
ncbi:MULTISPECIES: hypothetical protein [Pseudomonas]|jgi:hypothetical protein|uniref:Uncharacterized protein n=2 Tax=Pseudomonas veronii TaxID=76761 RepID=A0A0R3AYA7_PSEVE|nr:MULTISPECIES: hypothetical protein [Pseudomonas]SEC00412.1 hypothetical protein SAMN04490199_3528 [Pseudomonas marginalis]KRP77897.1 hypothetical protein TU80_13865 [Pseudomonas veronii]MBI6551107.1 hypothetical protein [Pseudomonas veronii]MBI6648959.1 hypothetical protein [Pseudomonas veronii]MBJ2177263.1 hypothetical protein [Pseudomonas veronii]|eukprot:TRINITY_DN100901_c0_g1_i1.p1 TRINITY_DN100901_c0_g1~~TRINITY_DN100901_c0_g1_i1.p1  ORF type:complete len:100 (-),score=14.50 TRINITY_DN100901_c0_g1_i1:141-440(-)